MSRYDRCPTCDAPKSLFDADTHRFTFPCDCRSDGEPQDSLDPEAKKILYDNLWDLYDSDSSAPSPDVGGDRRFPVHPAHRKAVADVPWSLVAPYESRAQKNHGQTLERLAERGGLDLHEMFALLEDREWSDRLPETPLAVAHAYITARAALQKAEEERDRLASDLDAYDERLRRQATEMSTVRAEVSRLRAALEPLLDALDEEFGKDSWVPEDEVDRTRFAARAALHPEKEPTG